MKILKRILLLIGFVPVMIFLVIAWILTGVDIDKKSDQFINWCSK